MSKLLLLAVVLAGCSSNPYLANPQFDPPETRAIAANWLVEALLDSAENDEERRYQAFGVSNIAGDEVRLKWSEAAPMGRNGARSIQRELIFSAIQSVSRPEHRGDFWEVQVEAIGGKIVFHFKENRFAAAAEAALLRLMRPVSSQEIKTIGRKMLSKLSVRGSASASWAEGSLRELTSQDFGLDPDKWRAWLDAL